MSGIYKILELVLPATGQTCLMVLLSTVFSLILGFPLGVLLCVSDPVSGIKPRKVLFQILTRIVNALRSFPFIILMILLFLHLYGNILQMKMTTGKPDWKMNCAWIC